MKLIKIAAVAAVFVGLTATSFAETFEVGAYPSNPPWEYKNEQSQFEGFEVDLVKEIADRLGAEVNFADLGFQALFAATSSGRIDMAISTITITNERLQNQSFTQGYFDSDLALIATKDGIDGLDGLNGKNVGVLASSIAEGWVKERQEELGIAGINSYPDQQNLLLDVRAGRVAGAVGDIAGYQYAFTQMPDLEILARIPTGDRFGIMLPKDSPLLERVNAAITEIKQDGTLAEIHKKWFGVLPEDSTSTVTVLDIPTAE